MKRRKYGAGSVFQRSRDGKWIASWELPPENGRRRRAQRVADTEAAAWKAMRAAQGSSSSTSRKSTETVGAYLERWLEDVVKRTRRERTLSGYRAILSVLPDAVAGARLTEPRLAHLLQVWLNDLDRHPRTVQHYAACLRAAFGYAVKKGLMDRNPAADLDLPAIPKVDRIPLTAAQLRVLLDATRGDPLHPLYVTAAWTGLRQGELLGLRWQDVDLDRASLVVRSGLRKRHATTTGARFVLEEPKTEKSRRMVPLLPEVVEVLRELRKEQLARPGKLDQGLVFCTEAGSPLTGTNVTRWFQAALKRAGLPRVRFHDLRHGAASMLLEAGVDLLTVSRSIGHSNISTTADIYGHIRPAHVREAYERMRDAVG